MIGNKGLASIADAISKQKVLRVLDISSNNIDDLGMKVNILF